MSLRGKKVFIGLSGGVDSAVSAALLKRAGASVSGIFIKGWYPPDMPCTWAEERRDAMRVAARLKIPFITLDASAEYKKGVIDYLISEYKLGHTPNPDVMCNRDVKFGAFYRFAKAHGADYIATGHYCRGAKDQRYFLWAIPKHILAETIFPVGNMDKDTVRRLAKKFNLPVAEKKDSQGVCFLGSVSIEEFLKNEFGIHPGSALTEEGAVVGSHDGVLLSTIGQRVALRNSTEQGPWFVCAKDVKRNVLIVTRDLSPVRPQINKEIVFSHENWFIETNGIVNAQYRYRGPRIPGSILENRFISSVGFPDIPTPGQSIVFYRDDEMIGGGIIVS